VQNTLWRFALQHKTLLTLFAALALVPVVAQGLGEPFYITLGARILVYALAAMALNLVLGFAGLVSFGHAMFMGLGCYAVGILSFYGVDNGWLQLLVCVAVCVAVALPSTETDTPPSRLPSTAVVTRPLTCSFCATACPSRHESAKAILNSFCFIEIDCLV